MPGRGLQIRSPLRTVRIEVGGHPITAAPQITTEARALLARLPAINAPGH